MLLVFLSLCSQQHRLIIFLPFELRPHPCLCLPMPDDSFGVRTEHCGKQLVLLPWDEVRQEEGMDGTLASSCEEDIQHAHTRLGANEEQQHKGAPWRQQKQP